MSDDRRNYLIVGIFVVGMAAALFVWLALLAGRTGPTDSYYIVYKNVIGLDPGVEILYEGYPVGFIDDISPIERDGVRRFRVDVAVATGWPIPADAVATVTAAGLLSAFVIDIRGGSAEELLPEGSEIRGREATDVISALNSVAAETMDLIETGLRPLLDDVSKGAPLILDDLENITASLERGVTQLEGMLSEENAKSVSRILGNVDSASGQFDDLLSELRETRVQLDALVTRVDGMMAEDSGEVSVALADLNHSLATVARHVDAIASNLEGTTRNLNEFSQQLRDNPGLLLRGRAGGDAE